MRARKLDLMFKRGSPDWASAVVLVCLAPAILVLLFEFVAWTGCFWLGQELQKVADEALAVAVSSQDPGQGEQRARAQAERALAGRLRLPPDSMALTFQSQAGRLSVLLVCDASEAPLFALQRLLPMPSPSFVRLATQGRAGTTAAAVVAGRS